MGKPVTGMGSRFLLAANAKSRTRNKVIKKKKREQTRTLRRTKRKRKRKISTPRLIRNPKDWIARSQNHVWIRISMNTKMRNTWMIVQVQSAKARTARMRDRRRKAREKEKQRQIKEKKKRRQADANQKREHKST